MVRFTSAASATSSLPSSSSNSVNGKRALLPTEAGRAYQEQRLKRKRSEARDHNSDHNETNEEVEDEFEEVEEVEEVEEHVNFMTELRILRQDYLKLKGLLEIVLIRLDLLKPFINETKDACIVAVSNIVRDDRVVRPDSMKVVAREVSKEVRDNFDEFKFISEVDSGLAGILQETLIQSKALDISPAEQKTLVSSPIFVKKVNTIFKNLRAKRGAEIRKVLWSAHPNLPHYPNTAKTKQTGDDGGEDDAEAASPSFRAKVINWSKAATDYFTQHPLEDTQIWALARAVHGASGSKSDDAYSVTCLTLLTEGKHLLDCQEETQRKYFALLKQYPPSCS